MKISKHIISFVAFVVLSLVPVTIFLSCCPIQEPKVVQSKTFVQLTEEQTKKLSDMTKINHDFEQTLMRNQRLLTQSSNELADIENQKQKLQKQVDFLNQQASGKKINYLVTFEIYVSRVSLDLWQHMKDSANKSEVTLSVSEELYNSLEKGDDVVDSFRSGSLLISGSFSTLKMRVKNKQMKLQQ